MVNNMDKTQQLVYLRIEQSVSSSIISTYIGRCRTIDKEHVSMTYAGLSKFRPLILSLIQTHDMRYTEMTEHL